MRRQRFAQLGFGDVGAALQDAYGQHQKSRCTEAALQAVMVPERLLQRVQFVACGEPLDSAHPGTLGLHREHQAGAHRLVVDQHGAGAADAVLAAEMGAGETAILAQRIGQAAPWLNADRVLIAVHRESDVLSFAHCASHPASRSNCKIRCGVIGISKIPTPNGASASETALSTAAGAPIVPPSPTPLASSTTTNRSISTWPVAMSTATIATWQAFEKVP